MVAVVTALLAAYLLWLVWVLVMIWRQDKLPLNTAADSEPITVLTAFRNEADTLPALLFSLRKQAGATFSWLGVDDNSKDASADYVRSQAEETGFPIHLLSNSLTPGKRGAIASAVPTVGTDWILQTDADCRLPTTWVRQSSLAARQGGGAMAIFPLRFRTDGESRFWLSVVNTEFASVMAITCAMARANTPVMCNGANLAFRKDFWLQAAPHLDSQPHVGGDDMFLLDYAVSHRYRVTYCDAPGVWVDTEAPTSLSAFLRQRRRWASKWSGYRSLVPVIVGGFTVLGQTTFALATLMALSGDSDHLLWGLIGGKIALEGFLLARQLRKGGMDFRLSAFLFWQVAYLPYILATALPSLWSRKPATWKT